MKKTNHIIIIFSIILYILNKISLSKYSLFMSGYFNDILAGILLIAFTNLMFGFINKSIYKFVHIEIYLFAVGIFWEYITPLYKTSSISDPIDILAYMVGGFIYWIINKIVMRKHLI